MPLADRCRVPAFAVFAIATAMTAAHAESNCDWYAKTALKQQQQNQDNKCGFSGPAWSTDHQAHITWCATAGFDLLKLETQKRDQQLTACRTK